MKYISDKILLLTLCFLASIQLVAQNSMEAMKAGSLLINYEKTLHVIFPSDIKYFNIGNDNVVGDRSEEAPNVLRLKANLEHFEGETNVSVVTSDGKYYPYLVSYSDSLPYTYLDLKDAYKEPFAITVSRDKYVHLIFPYRVKYIDFGNTTISVQRADNVDNIIKIKAEETDFPETNLSVITDGGRFYTFDINYSEHPSALSFVVDNTEKTREVAMLDDNEVNNRDREKIQKAMDSYNLNMRLNARKNGVIFSIQNIFIRKNILFLKLELNNRSTIDYDIDFMRFYIQDKKIAKKTAGQQIIQEPLFMMGYKKQIPAKESHSFIVAFEKFTIPDKKKFIIEIQEVNGGRHFFFKIDNRQILNAEILRIK